MIEAFVLFLEAFANGGNFVKNLKESSEEDYAFIIKNIRDNEVDFFKRVNDGFSSFYLLRIKEKIYTYKLFKSFRKNSILDSYLSSGYSKNKYIPIIIDVDDGTKVEVLELNESGCKLIHDNLHYIVVQKESINYDGIRTEINLKINLNLID